jgi:hypothetical protein
VGEANHLQVGEAVLLSVSETQPEPGQTFSGTLRGDPIELVTLADGSLSFVLPLLYPGSARLEVTVEGLTASADVTIAEWEAMEEPETLVTQSLADVRQLLQALASDETDTSDAVDEALQQLGDAEAALAQLSAEELQQVAIIISRLQTMLAEEGDGQVKPGTAMKALGLPVPVGLPDEWAFPITAMAADVDMDVCMNEGLNVVKATVLRTWKIGVLVALGGSAGALSGPPGIVIVGMAAGVILIELDRAIKANTQLLDSCIDPIARDVKETFGISSSGKASALAASAPGAQAKATYLGSFEHGEPKFFRITTHYGLPDALKQEVASWYAALLSVAEKFPLPDRWITAVQSYLSTTQKDETPSGLRLQVNTSGVSGSLSYAGEDVLRLRFIYDDASAPRYDDVSFTIIDDANPNLDIEAEMSLRLTIDCAKFYDAVLGEWSVTLTTNYGTQPTTYRMMIYEGGEGEYLVLDENTGNDVSYSIGWTISGGSGLNGPGCIFSETGFWHFGFNSNPSSVMDYPLTGFYTEQWFPGRNGEEDTFDRRTYIKK